MVHNNLSNELSKLVLLKKVQMKFCDAKKTIYNIQHHAENTFHLGKFWSFLSSISSVKMLKSTYAPISWHLLTTSLTVNLMENIFRGRLVNDNNGTKNCWRNSFWIFLVFEVYLSQFCNSLKNETWNLCLKLK